MPGNTTFFIKAADKKITWGDIFSTVFKSHSKEDLARLFMAGTALSTPHESRMLSEWQKPWVFSRVGFAALGFILIMYVLYLFGAGIYMFIPTVFVGATVIPLVVLILLWELNIPRNIPIYAVLGMFFIGGALSLIFTLIFDGFSNMEGAQWAAITEEPAKLLALSIFLYKAKYKYTLNGILIGGAIGCGFAAFETMGYFLNFWSFDILVLRGLLAPGGHVVWAALYGGALAMAKGSDNLKIKYFISPVFLFYFAVAVGLHYLWNLDFRIYSIPVIVDVKFLILITVAWFFLLRIIKQGVNDCVKIPQSEPQPDLHSPPVSADAASAPSQLTPQSMTLRGVAGIYSGTDFPALQGRLVIGRDAKQVNIVFPPDARGISSVHCEVRFENGIYALIDRNSSNGTFLADGTKLSPGQPYTITQKSRFYLAAKENMFEIV
ncbi:MAG: PrsW family glutamic-type intramembrane protease [Oscillospiraceae bacterium]|nr:PrsW family glutamic-type intramembrane protease [Oscillospiraceae bacterium]